VANAKEEAAAALAAKDAATEWAELAEAAEEEAASANEEMREAVSRAQAEDRQIWSIAEPCSV
jgi:hypothetical protein